jgi:predicted transcriptional regulator
MAVLQQAKQQLKEIAKELNLVNHSTIVYHIDQVFFSLRTDKRMKYRHDFMLDIINGIERTVKRNKVISKQVLSQDDKDFILNNLNNNYSISYLSDVLNKTKNAVKFYLQSLEKEPKKVNKLQTFNLPKQTYFKIDY